MRNIHGLDENIGIGFYVSSPKGVKGTVKSKPEDFIVEEIGKDGILWSVLSPGRNLLNEKERYVHFTLVKKGLDTPNALRIVSKSCGIPAKYFSYAGLKDKKAVSAQRISVYSSYLKELLKFKNKNITLKDFTYARRPIEIGDLVGNHFRVTLRVEEEFYDVYERIKQVINELKKFGGLPNFYGYQRFGVKRCVNHVIGKLIVQRKFEEAIKIFLGECGEFESDRNQSIREKLNSQLEKGEYNSKVLSGSMYYEKIIIKHLERRPYDFEGAFMRLPRDIAKLFIHAYQSYIFNLSLSERYRRGIPINKAIEGDIVLIDDREFPRLIRVKEEYNFGEIFGSVVYPVVGYDSKLPTGEAGEVIEWVLEKEGINRFDFFSSVNPRFSSEGSYRLLITPINDLRVTADEKNRKVTVEFTLRKGSYATVLIREILKENYVNPE